jgi:hypothetical protein
MRQPYLAITSRHDGTAACALRATAVRIAGLEPVALDRGLPGDGFPGFWRPPRQCRAGLAGPGLVPARGPPEAQHVIGAAQGILQVPIREDVIGSGPPPARPPKPGPRSSQPCPPARRCRATAFSPSSPASSCADPDSMSSDPRWDEYTICTAVAPDAVFTVRTYGTRPLYGPGLVRRLARREPGTRRSERRASRKSLIVSHVR